MDEAAKRRLVGAAVLIALAVIFVPMLIEQDGDDLGDPIVIPEPPAMQDEGLADDEGANAAQPLADAEELALPLPTPEPPRPARLPTQSADQGSQAATPSPAGSTDSPGASTSAAASAPSNNAALAPAGPKAVPAGASAWVVQVSSLGSSEAARSLQDELRAKGYSAFVEQAEVRGRQYYRVRVGPEIERARADRIAQQLAGETGAQPLVQRYP